MIKKQLEKYKELLKKQKKQPVNETSRTSEIPFRLNFLFFIVFALFVALLVQLAYLQIANGSFFNSKIKWSQQLVLKENAPRGSIYDAKDNVLVGNKAEQAIIYTKKKAMSSTETKEVSQKIAKLIDVPVENITERDKKDYWLADKPNLEKAQERLKKNETVNAKGEALEADVVYQNTVAKVKKSEIDFDDSELKAIAIFKKISGAYTMAPVTIKNKDVTMEEVASVGESRSTLPGLSTGMDWDREYPQDDFMNSILGTVSSEKNGLPQEMSDKYVANGYSRNDRVGLSNLEKQYETVLKGTKAQSKIVMDSQTNKIKSEKQVYPGEKGKNLKLTVDMKFQKKVEDILRENYEAMIAQGKTVYSEGAYAVVSDPKTGAINAMAGFELDHDEKKLKTDTLGIINKAFTPGSIVKPATIMAGYESGVISGNETLVDEFIELQGDPIKKSVFTFGPRPMTAVDALRESSNVYMMKIAFKMMGIDYVPNMVLGDHTEVFDILRKTYQDFGLGAPTGIDIAGESYGLSPKNHYENDGTMINGRMGNLLDLSYGNFDTYTPMQLTQYVNTIANSGKKLAPHIVEGIYENNGEDGSGDLVKKIEPRVLAQIGTKEQYDIIHEGMYQVVNANGSGHWMAGTKYVASAKTGTAEVPRDNPDDKENPIELYNSTMIAYAPSDDPKVTVSVVLPHISDDQGHENSLITAQILDAYYDFYEEGNQGDEDEKKADSEDEEKPAEENSESQE